MLTTNKSGTTVISPRKIVTPRSPEIRKADKALALGHSLSTEQARERFKDLASAFVERDRGWVRFLIIGYGKSGKTHAVIHTAPTPILLMMFDPNSEQLVSPELVSKGLVLPVRYFGDDPEKPYLYRQWEKDVFTWKADGFFSCFATVCIDSLSQMMVSQLRQIAYDDTIGLGVTKKGERKSLMPQIQDYNVLKISTVTTLLALCTIDAHIVLNAHILEERNFRDMKDMIGFVQKRLNATPALQANVPPLFSEVYIADSLIDKKTRKQEWFWQTTRSDKFPELNIGSIISGEKKLVKEEEEQDYRKLLKKCGFHHEDKPPLSG